MSIDSITYNISLDLAPQPEGGFTVTSPDLPELVTEGDTVEEAMRNAEDAFRAVLEVYEDEGRKLPEAIRHESLSREKIRTQLLVVS